jgi:hypothetical protein
MLAERVQEGPRRLLQVDDSHVSAPSSDVAPHDRPDHSMPAGQGHEPCLVQLLELDADHPREVGPRHRVTDASKRLEVLMDIVGDVLVRLAPVSIADLSPAEYRADVVFEIRDRSTGELLRAVIVEVQLAPDDDKAYAWPFYIAGMRARLRCPVLLVVVTTKRSVARWAERAIDLDGHGGFVFRPHVIGPDRVPFVDDADAARALPELAVLSAIAHRNHRRAVDVGRAALTALRDLDDETGRLYYDFVIAHLGRAARRALEAEMGIENYQYQSDFAKKFISEGRAEALVESILAVLQARGLAVTDDVRRRLDTDADPDDLREWLRRAVVITTIDDLFAR